MRCSPREDGCGEGGPEPALCHLVMSTRCGAACGLKQTASQGRAPACAQTQAPPLAKAESQAPPINSQAEPHLRTPEVASFISPVLPIHEPRPLEAGAGWGSENSPEAPPAKTIASPLASSKMPSELLQTPLPYHLPQNPAHKHQAASPHLGRNRDKRFINLVFTEV